MLTFNEEHNKNNRNNICDIQNTMLISRTTRNITKVQLVARNYSMVREKDLKQIQIHTCTIEMMCM